MKYSDNLKKNKMLDAYNIFLNIEKKYNLLEFNIDGIYIWQYLRSYLFEKVRVEAGIMDEAHSQISDTFRKILLIPKYLISSLIKNPFYISKRGRRLIFEHPRNIKQNNEYVDIFTHYLKVDLRNSNERFYTISARYLGKQYNWNHYNYHKDFIELTARILRNFTSLHLTNYEKNKIIAIENELNKEFGISFDLYSLIITQLKSFKIYYKLYKKLLIRLKPVEIYLVVGYGFFGSLIKAAKELKIPVFELQHGIISKYHLGYSYPSIKKNSLEYFPDYLIIWDALWKNANYLPLSKDRLIVSNKNHLHNQYLKYEKKKNEKQILIISQGTVGEEISNIIYKNYSVLKDYDILYKLHPGEYDRYNYYSHVPELKGKVNIKFLDDNSTDLYQLLSVSKYVFGVYSTVLYEAMYFECEIYVLDLPGHEYFEDFISAGKMKLLTNNDMTIIKISL